ncbi:coagulation factor VII-like [Astyanax mexicanus]|uniref:Coagulation factor VII n=1 Tax=Astyanax mexicanus TaxID=7994 RepID=A0A8B9K0V2_ASTMX|nr:coagulation factor VII-like [Astyanax mexicanus]
MESSPCGMKLCFLITLLSVPACLGHPAAPVFLSRTEANQVFLHRFRRANSFLEELKIGNLERECLEEKCSYEEAREIFTVPEQLQAFWKVYTEADHCKSEPCANGATCNSQGNNYICICPPKFEGRNCDKATVPENSYVCLYKNGGCEHFCTDVQDSVHQCHCAPGYSLGEDNSSCIAHEPFACGRPVAISIGPKVVKGNLCPKGQCPWQALLEYKGVYKCGAIVLNSWWILTAAHCVWQQEISQIQVTVGEHIRFKKEGTEQTRRVSKVFIHPLYNHSSTDSDIALLRLRRNITLNPYIVPICLPPSNGTFVRTLGTVRMSTVSGWGLLSQFGPSSTVLQRLEVPKVPLEQCQAHSGLTLTNNMLCAGFKEGGRDACKGDSGGPLVTLYNKTWFLTGIVSWGKGCARSDMYGIYTRVSIFVDWIMKTMAMNE